MAKIKLTVGKKISSGFGILIILTLVNFIITFITLDQSSKLNNEIIKVYTPSVEALEEFNLLIVRSRTYINNWVLFESRDDISEKNELRKLIKVEYPALKSKLNTLSRNWDEKEIQEIQQIFKDTDKLFSLYSDIMGMLNSLDSYSDLIISFETKNMIDQQGGDLTLQSTLVLKELNQLISEQQQHATEASNRMLKQFDVLQFIVSNSGIILLLGGVFIAFITVRTIVKPVTALKHVISSMSLGVIPEETIPSRDDEIGDMGQALDKLITSVKSQTDFSLAIGSGNFETKYTPLSDQDSLGKALIKMRDELRDLTSGLEEKVNERTKQVMEQKAEIEEKNDKLEKLYNDVTDSIRYAKRLQDSILPPLELTDKYLPEYFILFRPRDIVSGDFYWMNVSKNDVLIASADCTGHGVPGAFMSLVSNNMLNSAVNELGYREPARIFEAISYKLNRQVQENSKDGMDCSMLRISKDRKKIQFAGANNPLYWCRKEDEEMQIIKADKHPLEVFLVKEKEFTNHEIDIKEGDCYYIFSDGFPDQFGGPDGRKFMYKKFRQMLFDNRNLPMAEQKELLNTAIDEWRGPHKQIDDILVIGLRF